MRMRNRLTRRIAAVVAVVAMAAAATGCGRDEAASDAVPALGRQLESVDTAISKQRYDDARAAIKDLVNTAAQARVDGRLSGDEADTILRAAAALLAKLPDAPGSRPTTATTPSAPATSPDSPEPSDEPSTDPESSTLTDQLGSGDDEEEMGGPEDDEGSDQGSDEGGDGDDGGDDGGGNGPSSGNGPDDGHGN